MGATTGRSWPCTFGPKGSSPKCAEDRSLAIAHNLEGIFWAQDRGNPDKWHPRDTPTTSIEELVTHHHNPAITAALDKLK